ncbi:hypothetical protein VTJ83DRAFT_5139 [Remersonia thermophila]|uniref:Zn(2)-C6 fungal-type domain-containing protein n=1 Tax=Remersonia thermophila TaxID=72144 RepID=A0ABR4DBY1_9PEZI
MSSVARSTALRAGGACVRCRKGKTKCVYENGRAPCKNCSKGFHDCYLPSESMSHGGHGVSPARVQQRARESLPSERTAPSASTDRPAPPPPNAQRMNFLLGSIEKVNPELVAEAERAVSKTLPACVAFHKPSFIQQLKNNTMEASILNALLTTAARQSPAMIRRFGSHHPGGPIAQATGAAEHFANKTISHIMHGVDQPTIADIQALCLLVIHEWGSRNAVRAYIYLGMAARMAQMYRVVHTHHQQPEPDQFLQDESLRRTLWLIYILDCFLTSSPGRHPALSSHDIKDVSLPCLDMNYHFGSPVTVRTLSGLPPSNVPENVPMGEVGEFGHIVLATKAWRNVVEMMTTTTLNTFSEERCLALEQEIDHIRQSLPAHFADKANQINLHITMGSGYTYAMIHCLLNCATIFVNRRRILQIVTDEEFTLDDWRLMSHTHAQMVDRIFAASHSIIQSLLALESGADKDTTSCFPIFMLFSAFTAGSTVAYLTLKGLAPSDVTESATAIVRDSLRFCQDGVDFWHLVVPWHRHLAVMSKVLREVTSASREHRESRENSRPAPPRASPSVKDDAVSQADTNPPDVMDYDHTGPAASNAPTSAGAEGRDSEPPVQRRPGVTTINGGSAGGSTPIPASPPPSGLAPPKAQSPGAASSTSAAANPPTQSGPDVDMTAMELCAAFERQLLELDDLAAFMGGGVP